MAGPETDGNAAIQFNPTDADIAAGSPGRLAAIAAGGGGFHPTDADIAGGAAGRLAVAAASAGGFHPADADIAAGAAGRLAVVAAGGGGFDSPDADIAGGSPGRLAVVAAGGGGFHPAGADDGGGLADPERFAAEVLGVRLWDKQRIALQALTRRRRVAVKSGNGLGKDFTAAVAALWFLSTHNPAIVLSTAPTFRQVRNVLWRQVHALHRRARQPLGGELFATRWELASDRYALGLSATRAEQFQGFHSPNLLVIVDEAEGVSDPIYEAIEAVMTSANARLLLIGNPTRPSGGFYQAFHREAALYETVTISALESPNVVAGRVVIPGMTTAEWVAERRRTWGEQSGAYQSRILGEFPPQGDDQLIAMDDIEEAMYAPGEMPGTDGFRRDGRRQDNRRDDERRYDDIIARLLPGWSEYTPVAMGVDVARYGADRSVILLRRGRIVDDIRVFSKKDLMSFTGAVVDMARACRPDRINVDVVGLGSGVVDRLREQGIAVRAVNGASKPMRATECANLRAEGYWNLAERFQNRRIRIPQDAELVSELSELRYRYNSMGKLLLESKEVIRYHRNLPSPDKADALMLAFLDEPPPPPPIDNAD